MTLWSSPSAFPRWGGPPGPQPTPPSASRAWITLNSWPKDRSGGTRADRGSAPQFRRQVIGPLACVLCLVAAAPAFSATYILTVAGLGGEPDYEQRFAALATDTDKILKTGAQGDRIVETLKGADATRAKMEASLNRIASQAKPADAFVLMMIGHG